MHNYNFYHFIILIHYILISSSIFFNQAIKHKLQIKTSKAITDGGASPQEEDKARMLFGSKLVVNMPFKCIITILIYT